MTVRSIRMQVQTVRGVLGGRVTTWVKPRKLKKAVPRPGDVLWVQEPFALSRVFDLVKASDIQQRAVPVYFEAGGSIANQPDGTYRPDPDPPFRQIKEWVGWRRPAMYMPAWACRLQLRVVDAAVAPLREMTQADALRAGVVAWRFHRDGAPLSYCVDIEPGGEPVYSSATAIGSYSRFWDACFGIGCWARNPDVVTTTFEVIPWEEWGPTWRPEKVGVLA
jgi:hypothetical protein